MATKGDETTICGVKGATGVAMVKTTQTIIVGLYSSPMQSANALATVQTLADQLSDNGY
jgi:profilin